MSWSNLPITKSFVVMVHDWLDYLTQPAATQFNLAVGGQIEVAPPAQSPATSATVRLPDGSSKPLTLREAGDGFAFRYSQTHVPGLYEVRLEGTDAADVTVPFEVVRDAAESDLTELTDQQREDLTQAAGLEFPQKFTDLVPAATGSRQEKPIWNTLLAAVLILLVCELLLATRAARRRTSTASFASSLEADGGLFPSPAIPSVMEGRGA